MVRILIGLLLVACKGDERPVPPPVRDPHSYAEPDRVAVKHVELELDVDFTKRTLRGTARLTLARHDRDAPLRLDADSLAIESVTDCATKQPLAYELTPKLPIMGSALVVKSADCVAIAYATGSDARALLWVEPSGTAGKTKPMLFTQSQAIHARTWIPIQDTPSVRFTYDATIRVPDGLWAVMSAKNPQQPPSDGVWKFAMEHPVPSYLLALAVGDLAFRALGPRTGVYAEPSMIDAAAYEFAEVDAMMTTVEKLYGPYRWDRYDVLVLPPSFPFGGMENPRLTFLTPTVITGDRALVSLIAHELAHSWSGNLVTNASWSDIWLNEGVTTYVERRIMEELRGKDRADVGWYLGRKDLEAALAKAAPADTRLALALPRSRDPEDLPGDVSYEKGALFLQTLERAFGRERFDPFLHEWFEHNAFRSRTTAHFEVALRELRAKHPDVVSQAQTDAWLHQPGIPKHIGPAKSTRVDELSALATKFAATGELFDPTGWTTVDWVVVLRALPADVSLARLRALDDKYKLTASPNAQLQMYWLPLLVRADSRDSASAVEAYLLRVGRRWLIRGVYEAMIVKGGTWRELAKSTYDRAKPLYHPLVRETIEKMLAAKT